MTSGSQLVVDEELSIGDYVLSAASCRHGAARGGVALRAGVVQQASSVARDSFARSARPRALHAPSGRRGPHVAESALGDHAAIERCANAMRYAPPGRSADCWPTRRSPMSNAES